MNPLVVRTAAPFGYLIVFGGLLALAALAVAGVVRGLRTGRRGHAALGAAAVAFSVYVIALNAAADSALDLNPRLSSRSLLLGHWDGPGRTVLELATDGTYRCTGTDGCERLHQSGRWERTADFDVTFTSTAPGTAVRFRVVSYNGRLRLAHPIDNDPDLWNGEMPFEKSAPVT